MKTTSWTVGILATFAVAVAVPAAPPAAGWAAFAAAYRDAMVAHLLR